MVALVSGTVMGDLTALRVSPAEEAEAYGLLVACSAWLRSKGSAQWAVPYPRERFARDVAGAPSAVER